ncbi:MAG: hypothetical protein ABWZ52_05670 [Acidimicrobiales bacterium]
MQVPEHQHPVGVERLEGPVGHRLIVKQQIAVGADDRRPDRGHQLLEGDGGHVAGSGSQTV